MWNFVLADKAQFALFAKTNFHIQKCNTCRYIEKQNYVMFYYTIEQYDTAASNPATDSVDFVWRSCLVIETNFVLCSWLQVNKGN